MTQSSWPSPDNSRAVNDTQYEQLVAAYAVEGLVGSPGDGLGLFADSSGKQVKVKAGTFAHVRGHAWTTDADLALTVTDNTSGLTRYDRVVLRLDRSTWNVTAVVKAGTPGAGIPPSPQRDLGTSGLYEMPLGSFPVPTGFSNILATVVVPEAWYLVPGGGITCLSTSRPPHAVGRRIYEANTGKQYVSSGSVWLLTGEDTGWITLAAPSGIHYTYDGYPPLIRRLNGVVHFRPGDIRCTTAMTPSAVNLETAIAWDASFNPSAHAWVMGAANIGGVSPIHATFVAQAGGLALWRIGGNVAAGTLFNIAATSWPV